MGIVDRVSPGNRILSYRKRQRLCGRRGSEEAQHFHRAQRSAQPRTPKLMALRLQLLLAHHVADDDRRTVPPNGRSAGRKDVYRTVGRMTTVTDTQHEMGLKDVAQILVGAGALASTVAMSTDTWEIAKGLSPGDLATIACTSVLLIASFVYAAYFRGHLREHWPHLLGRVLATYALTAIVSSFNLFLVNQAPWLTDPTFALSETVLVSLPASFAASIVDQMS